MSGPTADYHNLVLVGTYGIANLYAFEMGIYLWIAWAVLTSSRHDKYGERRLLFFGAGLLCMVTGMLVFQLCSDEDIWTVHAAYSRPSGQPLNYDAAFWYKISATAFSLILSLTSDALLIHRAYAFVRARRVFVIPFILYLEVAFMTIVYYRNSRVAKAVPSSIDKELSQIALAHPRILIALTFALPVLVTTVACTRWAANHVEMAVGRKVPWLYLNSTWVVTLPMALHTSAGLAYVITLGSSDAVSTSYLFFYLMLTGRLFPQLAIITRVLTIKERSEYTSRVEETCETGGDRTALKEINAKPGDSSSDLHLLTRRA